MNPHRACLPRRTVVTAAFLCVLTNGGPASTIQVHGAHDPWIEIISECDRLTISVKCPVKGLLLSTPEGEGVASYRDDGFDVVPGHAYTVEAPNSCGVPKRATEIGREVRFVTSGYKSNRK